MRVAPGTSEASQRATRSFCHWPSPLTVRRFVDLGRTESMMCHRPYC
jgi:hypothetical protein